MNAYAAPGLPVNLVAEQGVLGTLLINNAVLPAIGFLKPEHFSEPLHRAIFEAAVKRIQTGQPANAITLSGDLPPVNDRDVTTIAYLAQITGDSWSTSDQIAGTARDLVRLAARRELMSLAADIADMAQAPAASPADIIAVTESNLITLATEVSALETEGEAHPDDILAAIDQRRVSGRYHKGVECGLAAIDYKLGGFAPGEMIVMAGRPGMGKTALGLSLARRAAHTGVGVAYVSLEMNKDALWHRLLSDEALSNSAIPYKNIGRGRLSDGEFHAVGNANERVKELPLVIRDRGSRLSDLPGHIRAARAALERMGKRLDIVVVDYLGLLQASDRYAGQKVNEVGEISATVKALAKREGVAVLALHQLSRANEARDDRRPRLSDLRDSGNLEQDADVVMFVYREAYYLERPGYRNFASDAERYDALDSCKHKLELIVAKQRQGDIGVCHLWVDIATNSIRDEARI